VEQANCVTLGICVGDRRRSHVLVAVPGGPAAGGGRFVAYQRHCEQVRFARRWDALVFHRRGRLQAPINGGFTGRRRTCIDRHYLFSRDGKWAVYNSYPDYALWRSRADGSDRLQLSYPPLFAASGLDISPDGSRVAFSAINPGHGYGIYEVSMEGGTPRMLSENGRTPAWSPDGAALVFNQLSPTGEMEILKSI
jgi:Tol biopolymer transport system component